MFKIAVPSSPEKDNKDFRPLFAFGLTYLFMLFLITFRWGPAQFILSSLVNVCQDTLLKTDVALSCSNWHQLAQSNW